jgi:predicted HNH restriction endonuclease
MPFKDPQAKKAWRAANRDRQVGYKRRHDAKRAAAILCLPDEELARRYLNAVGFYSRAQSLVAEWARNHPESRRRELEATRSADRRHRHKMRLAAIEFLGGRCECCGLDVPEVLEFDHREPILRKRNGIKTRDTTSLAREIISTGGAGFQLLCANCHALKTRANGEHTGQKVDIWGEILEGFDIIV